MTDYLRRQAVMRRKLAEQADDPFVKNDIFELASVCEEVANNIDDHLTVGKVPKSDPWLTLNHRVPGSSPGAPTMISSI
jgi:hypothetical protein